MNEPKIEIRIRYTEEDRHTPWETMSFFVVPVPDGTAERARGLAHAIAENIRFLELRWNWQGATQGHYITPEAMR